MEAREKESKAHYRCQNSAQDKAKVDLDKGVVEMTDSADCGAKGKGQTQPQGKQADEVALE